MESSSSDIIYLDNNATTLMSKKVIDALIAWCNRGDPSSGHIGSQESHKMMNLFRQKIAIESGFELDGPNAYAIVFTSGASESNCYIVTSAVRSYAKKTGHLPHVITSEADHKSLIDCCISLEKQQLCQLTILPIGKSGLGIGAVNPVFLSAAIRPNTCLVSIIAANNETGILNDLQELSKITKKAHIPFHTDAAQLFGKSLFLVLSLGIDAFSASFHKIGGPPGVGILVLRRNFIEGYSLCPHIYGNQNSGMRGGAENLPGIGASFVAFNIAMTNRAEKSSRMLYLRNSLKTLLESRVPCFYIDDYPADQPLSIDGGITPPKKAIHSGSSEVRSAIILANKQDSPIVLWIAPTNDKLILPNTLLISVHSTQLCSNIIQKSLEKYGIIISIYSDTCRVIVSMNIPIILRTNLLRISISDDSNENDIKSFVSHFITIINNKS